MEEPLNEDGAAEIGGWPYVVWQREDLDQGSGKPGSAHVKVGILLNADHELVVRFLVDAGHARRYQRTKLLVVLDLTYSQYNSIILLPKIDEDKS